MPISHIRKEYVLEVEIQNCNNIDYGSIQIVENRLNIKYAINGTGKSTLSRAICSTVLDREKGSNDILELTQFKAIGSDSISPSVSGCEEITNVNVFDENYINDFIYQPDELLEPGSGLD